MIPTQIVERFEKLVGIGEIPWHVVRLDNLHPSTQDFLKRWFIPAQPAGLSWRIANQRFIDDEGDEHVLFRVGGLEGSGCYYLHYIGSDNCSYHQWADNGFHNGLNEAQSNDILAKLVKMAEKKAKEESMIVPKDGRIRNIKGDVTFVMLLEHRDFSFVIDCLCDSQMVAGTRFDSKIGTKFLRTEEERVEARKAIERAREKGKTSSIHKSVGGDIFTDLGVPQGIDWIIILDADKQPRVGL